MQSSANPYSRPPKSKGSSVIRATRGRKPTYPIMEAMLIDSGDLPGPAAEATKAEIEKPVQPATKAKATKREPSPELKVAAEAPKLSAIGTVARAMDDALIFGGIWTDLAKSVGKPLSQLRSHAKWRTRAGSPWRLEEDGDNVKMVSAK
jgi:hypothetical protein